MDRKLDMVVVVALMGVTGIVGLAVMVAEEPLMRLLALLAGMGQAAVTFYGAGFREAHRRAGVISWLAGGGDVLRDRVTPLSQDQPGESNPLSRGDR